MILTQNRRIILTLIDVNNFDIFYDSDKQHPYTCKDIHFHLQESVAVFSYCTVEDIQITKAPSIKQIERTLRDLVSAGLVNIIKQKSQVVGSMTCEKFVNHYELASQSEENARYRKIYERNCQVRKNIDEIKKKLKHTCQLYLFGKEVIKEEFDSLMKSLKKTLGQLHPDKLDGDNTFSNDFSDLKKIQDEFKALNFLDVFQLCG